MTTVCRSTGRFFCQHSQRSRERAGAALRHIPSKSPPARFARGAILNGKAWTDHSTRVTAHAELAAQRSPSATYRTWRTTEEARIKMTGENENAASPAGRLRVWSYGRIWSAITLAAVLVAFLHDSEPLLRTVQQADYPIADPIKGGTPPFLIDGFNARAAECNYRWLVYCAAKPSRLRGPCSAEPSC